MKNYILLLFLFGAVVFGATSVSAQCDPTTASQIKCSYYNEGYQDGSSDARNNQTNDYRRYRTKYDRQYESLYRDGYTAGFSSVAPTDGRWSYSQRSAYDSGYTIGQNDRRRSSQPGSSERNNSRYDRNIAVYFQQGYDDGFGNRPKQYDVPLGQGSNYPPFPGGGNGRPGTAYWNGRVDDRGNIIIRGSTINAENAGGNGVQTYNQSINGSLPRRRATVVNANKVDGRGTVTVIQQPDRSNDYTAIVQVYDPKGGSSDYKVEISWAGGQQAEEPYSSGSISWRGRVDQTAKIIISGGDVQTQDASGTGISNVTFNLNGYLAGRPGIVGARKRNGRGTVTIIQQPTRDNDYTAIVQVFDPKSGADDYEVDITW